MHFFNFFPLQYVDVRVDQCPTAQSRLDSTESCVQQASAAIGIVLQGACHPFRLCISIGEQIHGYRPLGCSAHVTVLSLTATRTLCQRSALYKTTRLHSTSLRSLSVPRYGHSARPLSGLSRDVLKPKTRGCWLVHQDTSQLKVSGAPRLSCACQIGAYRVLFCPIFLSVTPILDDALIRICCKLSAFPPIPTANNGINFSHFESKKHRQHRNSTGSHTAFKSRIRIEKPPKQSGWTWQILP